MSPKRSPANKLWVITSFFNPAGFNSRLCNYRLFHSQLNLPVITVEMTYGESGELTEQDAEVLIRLRGRDVMWQKERLLNIALEALPDDCEMVAWLDCDIVFESADWADRACKMLDRRQMVHPLSQIFDVPITATTLTRETMGDQTPTPSLVRNWDHGLVTRDDVVEAFDAKSGGRSRMTKKKRALGTAGLGWVARRELAHEHGLYDAFVVGGGDGGIVAAALGFTDLEIRKKRMHPEHVQHYMQWAAPFERSVAGKVGAIEGAVFHLWHGELENRRYWQRHLDFAKYQFNPYEDIALDPQGCWCWNSDKPEMHQFVKGFFESRREDG